MLFCQLVLIVTDWHQCQLDINLYPPPQFSSLNSWPNCQTESIWIYLNRFFGVNRIGSNRTINYFSQIGMHYSQLVQYTYCNTHWNVNALHRRHCTRYVWYSTTNCTNMQPPVYRQQGEYSEAGRKHSCSFTVRSNRICFSLHSAQCFWPNAIIFGDLSVRLLSGSVPENVCNNSNK